MENQKPLHRTLPGWGLALAAACLGLFSPPASEARQFTEVTGPAGLRFDHRTGRGEAGRPPYFMPEIMGSGLGLLDHDGDGDLDLYLVQGEGADRLFENLGDFRFREAAAGVRPPAPEAYGMGVAVGDADNDGDLDLFRTGYGGDALLQNTGEAAGFARGEPPEGEAAWDDRWSASAAFCDYDADGRLDLFVTRYMDYDPDFTCHAADGRQDYCNPADIGGLPDLLYRNLGGGRFREVGRGAGIAAFSARGLGVVCHDFTGDGRLDFYVANDTEANHLWVNRGDGTFGEEALLLGAALSGFGRPEAGMGVDIGDLDGDLDLDILLTHFADETNTVYLAEPEVGFTDASIRFGLGVLGLGTTGFGVALGDWNHDGRLDAVVANGRVARPPGEGPGEPFFAQYAEPALVLQNDGGRFRDRTGDSPALLAPTVGRGLAAGDLDGDGDLDLALTAAGGAARLFRNDAEPGGRPLLVTLRLPEGRGDPGATVRLVTSAGTLTARANPGFSYLSSGDPRAHFGIRRGARIEGLVVRWSDGAEERFPPPADVAVTVIRGEGRTGR